MVQAKRAGRKSKADLESGRVLPYTVFQRETGGYYWSYKNPETGHYVKKEPLVTRGHSVATKLVGAAQAEAQARWTRMTNNAVLRAQGVEPPSQFEFEPLLEDYRAYHAAKARRRIAAEDTPLEQELRREVSLQYLKSIDRSFSVLRAHSRLGKLTDVRVLSHGPYIQGILEDLRSGYRPTHGKKTTRSATDTQLRPHLVALSGFQTWLHAHRGIGAVGTVMSIARDLPAARRPDTHFYYPSEMARIEKALLNRGDLPQSPCGVLSLLFEAYTGARFAELKRARVRDVRFRDSGNCEKYLHGEVHVSNRKRRPNRAGQRMAVQRIVPLFPRLADLVRAHIHRHQLRADDLLFFRRNNRCQPPKRASYSMLAAACLAAGVTYREGAHVFRHTYSTVRGETYHPNGGRVVNQDIKGEIGHSPNSQELDRTYSHTTRLSLSSLKERFVVIDYPAMAEALERAQAIVDAQQAEEFRDFAPDPRMKSFLP